jgi:cytochrome P450
MTFRQILLEKAEAGKPFVMEDLTNNLTFDIICTSTFGFSLESQKKGSLLLKTFSEITRAWWVERDAWNPFKKYWYRFNRVSAIRRMDNQLRKMVRARYDILVRDNVDLSKKRGLRMLDLLLRECYEEAKISGRSASKALDSEYMRLVTTNIKTLLLGGTGTSTDALCFVYMLLSTHPEAVKKLRAEHDRVFSPSIEETYSILQNEPGKLNELEFTAGVIKETLRFFPIGNTARGGRSTDDFLEWKGSRYPMKDWMMCPMQHTMHMDPKNFSDPGVFDPDRFARDDFKRLAWRPFERGARTCIGQNMAMDEIKVVLLLTVRDLDFECHDLKPFDKPAVSWWDMDTVYGDRAYQEFAFEAKPRAGMPMLVRKSGYETK